MQAFYIVIRRLGYSVVGIWCWVALEQDKHRGILDVFRTVSSYPWIPDFVWMPLQILLDKAKQRIEASLSKLPSKTDSPFWWLWTVSRWSPQIHLTSTRCCLRVVGTYFVSLECIWRGPCKLRLCFFAFAYFSDSSFFRLYLHDVFFFSRRNEADLLFQLLVTSHHRMELCSPKFQCKNWVQSTAVKCKHQWWFKIGNKLVRTCLQCLRCLHLDISPCRPSFGGFELRDFTGKFWETFKMDTKRIHKSSNILEHPTLFNSCFDCYHHCDLWPDSNRMMRSNPCRVYMLNICCRQNAFWAEPKFGFHPNSYCTTPK